MSSSVDVAGRGTEAGAFARFADRWIYVFMAALFIVTTLVGFIPDSIQLVGAVNAGRRPPLPPILHLHAVMMGCWLLLLLAQTTLMATGRKSLHRQLGLLSFALLPILPIVMAGVIHEVWSFIAMSEGVMPPERLARMKFFLGNVMLEQIRIMILFPVLVGWAIAVRKRDSDTHKRLMILASAIPLPAAVDRMTWMPTTMPDSPLSVWIATLVLLLPGLLYDLVRRGRIHPAYVMGLALNLPFVVCSYFLWATPWWLAMAPKIAGAL